jgi:hypothetical protein
MRLKVGSSGIKDQSSVAIFLTDRTNRKEAVAMQVIREHGAEVVEIKARGGFSQDLLAILLGDWTSCGLAKLKVDPLSICGDRIKGVKPSNVIILLRATALSADREHAEAFAGRE